MNPALDSRARFEAWHTAKFGRAFTQWDEARGRYAWDLTQELWQAWQAAIASRAAEVGALQAELAGNEASTMHLSRMVDDLRALLTNAENAMARVQWGAGPIDESNGDLDARIPYARWATFVDFHALLLGAIKSAGHVAPPTPQDPPIAALAAKETT